MSNAAVCAVWKSHIMTLDSFVVIRPWTYTFCLVRWLLFSAFKFGWGGWKKKINSRQTPSESAVFSPASPSRYITRLWIATSAGETRSSRYAVCLRFFSPPLLSLPPCLGCTKEGERAEMGGSLQTLDMCIGTQALGVNESCYLSLGSEERQI